MLTIHFHNDGSGDIVCGNYNVTVDVNGNIISKLRIEGHNRLAGWQGLVACLSEQVWNGEKGEKNVV